MSVRDLRSGQFGPLDADERRRRASLVESFLRHGYGPLRVLVGLGSATEAADRADNKASGTYARWVRDEEARRRAGRDAVLPDWSLYRPTGVGQTIDPAPAPSTLLPNFMPPSTPSAGRVMPTAPQPVEEEIHEDLDARARLLRDEVVRLVTASRFPLINPECIIVDTATSRKFDRKTANYSEKPSAPKTWLSETPLVAPLADARGRRFIFTAAQNDAPIHEAFWANLKAYAEHLGAEICVGPLTYTTSWWSEGSTIARSYAKEVEPHLCFGQFAIGDGFIFAGEMNTLVTASTPVGDLTTYPRNRWAVFPHAKRQLISVPSTDPNVQAHQVMTTGMVTRPKIVPRKAGVKSLFHQVIGAVVVEFDALGRVFCRQVTATEDGSFYDLDRRVGGGRVTFDHPVEAIVCGDVHLRKLDPLASLGTFGFAPDTAARNKGSMIDVLRPRHIVLHDVFDNETRNHHNAADPLHAYEMAQRGRSSVLSEITDVAEFLFELDRGPGKVIVVESNHDLGLERWVKEGRYRGDGGNLRIGLELDAALLDQRDRVAQALDAGLPPPRLSLLRRAIELTVPKAIETVEWAFDGTSRLIGGVECGHHGFRGANGSKGTIKGLAKTGRKMSIGDKHQPAIEEGLYVAGAMQLHMGYNRGPSSWAVAHVLHYADGQRAIVTMHDGAWRAERPRLSVRGGCA